MDRAVVSRTARPRFESRPPLPLGNLPPCPQSPTVCRPAAGKDRRLFLVSGQAVSWTAHAHRVHNVLQIYVPVHGAQKLYPACDTSINLGISPVDVPFLPCLKVCRTFASSRFAIMRTFHLPIQQCLGRRPALIPLLAVQRMLRLLSKPALSNTYSMVPKNRRRNYF